MFLVRSAATAARRTAFKAPVRAFTTGIVRRMSPDRANRLLHIGRSSSNCDQHANILLPLRIGDAHGHGDHGKAVSASPKMPNIERTIAGTASLTAFLIRCSASIPLHEGRLETDSSALTHRCSQ